MKLVSGVMVSVLASSLVYQGFELGRFTLKVVFAVFPLSLQY